MIGMFLPWSPDEGGGLGAPVIWLSWYSGFGIRKGRLFRLRLLGNLDFERCYIQATRCANLKAVSECEI